MLRKKTLLALLLATSLLAQGCIGSFALTKDVWTRNEKIDNKVGREALFVLLLVVPVYEVACLADMIVFNTVELFSDDNPWAAPQSIESRADMEP
jgi:hypothetical protein